MIKKMRNVVLTYKNNELNEKDNGLFVDLINNEKAVKRMNVIELFCRYWQIKKLA